MFVDPSTGSILVCCFPSAETLTLHRTGEAARPRCGRGRDASAGAAALPWPLTRGRDGPRGRRAQESGKSRTVLQRSRKWRKNWLHFSICACHPCAGAMLIFSVSFQFYRMAPPEGAVNSNPRHQHSHTPFRHQVTPARTTRRPSALLPHTLASFLR